MLSMMHTLADHELCPHGMLDWFFCFPCRMCAAQLSARKHAQRCVFCDAVEDQAAKALPRKGDAMSFTAKESLLCCVHMAMHHQPNV